MDEHHSSLISVKRILVAMDGSAPSNRAANFAIHLSKLENAELVILHVLPDIKQGGAIGLRAKYGDLKLVSGFVQAKKKDALEWIRPIHEIAKKNGIESKIEILEDDGTSVVGIITKYAQKNKIDITIVGTKGLSRFRRLLVGSVASALISHSPCPVLVVR